MEHTKKMVAPIIITIIVLVYWLAYVAAILLIPGAFVFVKVLFAILGVGFSVGMILVLISRIREIKGGKEDDLSNY